VTESSREKSYEKWSISDNMKSLRNFFSALFVLTLCTLTAWPARAEEKCTSDLIASIQQKYKAIHSIESKFVQKNFFASLNQFREFKGNISLKRPHLFEMEVSYPEYQRLVFDGQFYWIYVAASNQVLKYPVAPDFSDHPLISLLATMENLEKSFIISFGKTVSSEDYLLTLTLKNPEPEIREIHLTMKKKDFQIKDLSIHYGSGNYTLLALYDIKENSDIPPERFQFIPSPEIEIVESPTPTLRLIEKFNGQFISLLSKSWLCKKSGRQ